MEPGRGLEPQRPAEPANCGDEIAFRLVEAGEVAVRLSEIGPEGEAASVARAGLVQLAQKLKGVGAIGVRVGIVGPDRQRAIVAADGLLPLGELEKNATAIGMGLDKVMAHGQRPKQHPKGRDVLTGAQEHEGEVVQRLGKTRIKRQGADHERRGAGKGAGVNEGEAREVECVDVERIGGKRLLVEAERVFEPSPPVGGHGFSQPRRSDLLLPHIACSAPAHTLGLYRARRGNNQDRAD